MRGNYDKTENGSSPNDAIAQFKEASRNSSSFERIRLFSDINREKQVFNANASSEDVRIIVSGK